MSNHSIRKPLPRTQELTDVCKDLSALNILPPPPKELILSQSKFLSFRSKAFLKSINALTVDSFLFCLVSIKFVRELSWSHMVFQASVNSVFQHYFLSFVFLLVVLHSILTCLKSSLLCISSLIKEQRLPLAASRSCC